MTIPQARGRRCGRGRSSPSSATTCCPRGSTGVGGPAADRAPDRDPSCDAGAYRAIGGPPDVLRATLTGRHGIPRRQFDPAVTVHVTPEGWVNGRDRPVSSSCSRTRPPTEAESRPLVDPPDILIGQLDKCPNCRLRGMARQSTATEVDADMRRVHGGQRSSCDVRARRRDDRRLDRPADRRPARSRLDEAASRRRRRRVPHAAGPHSLHPPRYPGRRNADDQAPCSGRAPTAFLAEAMPIIETFEFDVARSRSTPRRGSLA